MGVLNGREAEAGFVSFPLFYLSGIEMQLALWRVSSFIECQKSNVVCRLAAAGTAAWICE